MDLAYLSDAFSHMTMRGGSYSRYDQPWGRGWAPEDRGLTGKHFQPYPRGSKIRRNKHKIFTNFNISRWKRIFF